MNRGRVSLAPRGLSTGHRPGDTVEVDAEWSLEAVPEALEARLFWFTTGKVTQDIGVVETQPIASDAKGSHTFRFRLPASPYSFAGKYVTLRWAVEFVVDDETGARWEFTMGPAGKEVRIA